MMLASTTAPLAAVVPVAGVILALLLGCFAVIFILAMFFRVVSGPSGRAALSLGAALVLLAAIRLVDGAWPGGRASRPSGPSVRVERIDGGRLRSAVAIRDYDATRSGESGEVEAVAIEEWTEDGGVFARRSAESARHSARERGHRHALQSWVEPEATIAPGTTVVQSESDPAGVGQQIRSTARQAVRRSRQAAHHVRSEARRSTRGVRSWFRAHTVRGIGGMLLTAFALAAFLFVGYVFLDAGTRGQFTWSLRLVSLLAFLLFFASLARWSVF